MIFQRSFRPQAGDFWVIEISGGVPGDVSRLRRQGRRLRIARRTAATPLARCGGCLRGLTLAGETGGVGKTILAFFSITAYIGDRVILFFLRMRQRSGRQEWYEGTALLRRAVVFFCSSGCIPGSLCIQVGTSRSHRRRAGSRNQFLYRGGGASTFRRSSRSAHGKSERRGDQAFHA